VSDILVEEARKTVDRKLREIAADLTKTGAELHRLSGEQYSIRDKVSLGMSLLRNNHNHNTGGFEVILEQLFTMLAVEEES